MLAAHAKEEISLQVDDADTVLPNKTVEMLHERDVYRSKFQTINDMTSVIIIAKVSVDASFIWDNSCPNVPQQLWQELPTSGSSTMGMG